MYINKIKIVFPRDQIQSLQLVLVLFPALIIRQVGTQHDMVVVGFRAEFLLNHHRDSSAVY